MLKRLSLSEEPLSFEPLGVLLADQAQDRLAGCIRRILRTCGEFWHVMEDSIHCLEHSILCLQE
jgi:hypothetical protein